MLKPSRSGVRPASSHGNDPTNQKKYTSHSAKPKAKRMLTPAMEKRPWRIVASVKSTPSPSRDAAHASRDLFLPRPAAERACVVPCERVFLDARAHLWRFP